MIKNIPNIISLLRILLSISLFFLKPFTLLFGIMYLACGFSDALDGYIARKTNSESKLGAIIDSIADFTFMIIVAFVFLPKIFIPTKILIWVILIAFIKILALLIGYFRYHAFAALHTYLNKLTGFLLFCFPILYKLTDAVILEYVICIVATICAIEELIIQIASKKLSRNIKGLFFNKSFK